MTARDTKRIAGEHGMPSPTPRMNRNREAAASQVAATGTQVISLTTYQRKLIAEALGCAGGGYNPAELLTVTQRRDMADLLRAKFRNDL